MMAALTSLLTWLLGSKAGRITALCLLALASATLAVAAIYRKGAASEKAKQTQASLDALRNRISTDDTLSKMPAALRRAELARWLRERD